MGKGTGKGGAIVASRLRRPFPDRALIGLLGVPPDCDSDGDGTLDGYLLVSDWVSKIVAVAPGSR